MQMKDVDHTHPYGDASTARSFERGPTVATDGGEPEENDRAGAVEPTDSDTIAQTRTMADVDHAPPHGEGATPAFERGGERQPDVPRDANGVHTE